jgi:hypothetical protein
MDGFALSMNSTEPDRMRLCAVAMHSLRAWRRLAACASLALCISAINGPMAQSGEVPPLTLEARIPLGNVAGRIDHMAIDVARQRLFVAELGNDTVGVVDLKTHNVVGTLTGLKEPQGVGFVSTTDKLYVANGRDGSVMVFGGEDYRSAGRLDLGEDADNIRVDNAANHVYVGYGQGALALIDARSDKKIADISLPAHPEGFQLSKQTRQIFVNLPHTGSIVVIDAVTGQQRAAWRMNDLAGHYPMALDEASRQVLVVFRSPARLGVFSMESGTRVTDLPTCGDSDDIFFDAKRARMYVSCGEGFVDVFERQGSGYRQRGRIPTAAGARTSFFASDLDLLAVAAPAGAQPAELWVFRPAP